MLGAKVEKLGLILPYHNSRIVMPRLYKVKIELIEITNILTSFSEEEVIRSKSPNFNRPRFLPESTIGSRNVAFVDENKLGMSDLMSHR